MTAIKNAVFIGLLLQKLFNEERINFWWKGIFLGGGGMSKLLAGGGRTPPISQKGKPRFPLWFEFFLISRKFIYHVCHTRY